MEFRPYYLSREWVKMGHRVIIIAGDYSHLRKINPNVVRDFQTESIDGINYVWLKTGAYESNGVKRAVTMGRFVRKLYMNAKTIVKKYKPDVVIASSTYPLDTWPAQRIARLANCKYVHEVHDMWPATLYEVGGMSKYHPLVVLMQIAENSSYKHCDYCVALLPYAKDYMVKHGLKPEKFVNIQNGVVEEEWKNYESIPEDHKIFFENHKEKFIVGYFGGHALSNALDLLLDTAELIIDNEIIFVLVGDGVEKKKLVERKDEESIKNLFFLDSINKKAIPDLIAHFDCTIITGKKSPLYRFGICLNKMYDSMMGGKPIICAISAPRTLVEEYDCGIQVSSAEPLEIKDAIIRMKNMTSEAREKMGKNGRKAIEEKFTYKELSLRFISAIKL